MAGTIIFNSDELLPASWSHFPASGPVRTFNPGLLREKNGGWLFAYRVVGFDMIRRIGLCRLSSSLQLVADSQVALSDLVRFPPKCAYPERVTTWFADPRLMRLAGRIFLYWNSGWHEPQNSQFLQEIDANSLQPVGYARELILQGRRRKLEKNWGIFGDDPFYAIYSIAPHRVLKFSLEGEGDIVCSEIHSEDWPHEDYTARFGELRGGAPPQLAGTRYYSFCHSVHTTPEGYRYVPAVYRFAAAPPFAPETAPLHPFRLANPFGDQPLHPRLNPAIHEVVYPCGAVEEDDRWIISYGINDEHCAIDSVRDAELSSTLRPFNLKG
ncbi:MAG: hypothetical protein PHQ04_03725 [Opitutaceae bacterium]|nr:hypothetical protein [Opitutaceae bacterium]